MVSPEDLDGLEASDPRAQRSRLDLKRVNRILGIRGLISREMQPAAAQLSSDSALRVLELGAGDGTLMLGIAREMADQWPAVQLTLLDRLAIVGADTRAGFERRGWSLQTLAVDVLDWAAATSPDNAPQWDVIVTNHFLHHFDDRVLSGLLPAIAAQCNMFIACEPRRTTLSLVGSYLIGAIGANAVTRKDAVLSVHAGFDDAELSTVWPVDRADWQLQERAAGLFTHLFRAARCGIAAD
jgi:2-polyprenyl-3-methyl-5-hydroxy-6-metoxy-1,4-benzoquinol methylase